MRTKIVPHERCDISSWSRRDCATRASERTSQFVRHSRPSRRTRRLCLALPVEFYSSRIVARPRSFVMDWVYHITIVRPSFVFPPTVRRGSRSTVPLLRRKFGVDGNFCVLRRTTSVNEHRTRGNDSLFSVVFFFRRPDSDSPVSNCWYGRVYHPRSSFLAEGRRELKMSGILLLQHGGCLAFYK